MASVKLARDLEEEILSRLEPRYLVRFRTVCKHWNALLNDKSFLNKHLSRSRPQFIFVSESKIYSIQIDLGGVDPTIKVHELASDFPCQPMNMLFDTITACDGLLFRTFWRQGVAIWNPWLGQVGWIEYADTYFRFCGVGYDSSRPEKGYKILGYFHRFRRDSDTIQTGYYTASIYECSSHALKSIDVPFEHWPTMDPLSLNGNLYWVTDDRDTEEYFIRSFDFSREIIKPFCLLPCQTDMLLSQLVLAVFKGDRFSLLKQCYETGKIEIWVTKKKIDDREEVVWINLMTLPTTNLPKLFNKISGIRYFIFDKTLIMCCGDDQTGAACIYIVRGDMFKKIQIDSGILQFSHCVYLPNFIPVPLEFRSLQV